MKFALVSTLAVATTLLAAAPAVAQDAEDETYNDDGIGVIVVTAQKREESLQDAAIAVSAIGTERLQDQQINNLQDLQVAVPAVTFGNDFNMAKIFIRGVGAGQGWAGQHRGDHQDDGEDVERQDLARQRRAVDGDEAPLARALPCLAIRGGIGTHPVLSEEDAGPLPALPFHLRRHGHGRYSSL